MPVVACPQPCPPITTGIVQFSSAEFVALYPEFTGIAAGVQQTAFNDATLLLDNSCGSSIQDANRRMALLYTLTAHCLFLENGSNDGAGNVVPPPGVVGRINAAAEGSVSVSAEYNADGGPSMAYYVQTKYGAKYWEQTTPYRSMQYVGAPSCGPNGPGFPWDVNVFGNE